MIRAARTSQPTTTGKETPATVISAKTTRVATSVTGANRLLIDSSTRPRTVDSPAVDALAVAATAGARAVGDAMADGGTPG